MAIILAVAFETDLLRKQVLTSIALWKKPDKSSSQAVCLTDKLDSLSSP